MTGYLFNTINKGLNKKIKKTNERVVALIHHSSAENAAHVSYVVLHGLHSAYFNIFRHVHKGKKNDSKLFHSRTFLDNLPFFGVIKF